MSEESDVEKTEDPTPHRRQKAREEGQIPRSKELTSLLMLLVGWLLLIAGGENMAERLMMLLHDGLTFDNLLARDVTFSTIRAGELLSMAMVTVLPMLGGLFLTALVSPACLGGLSLSGKSLKVDLTRLNPLSGIKRMISMQMVSELFKSLLKVVLVGAASTFYLFSSKAHMIQLIYEPLPDAIKDSGAMISRCMLIVILTLLPLVGYDVFYQLMSHLKKLRMSRQEIRDEHKQHEGDPHVKGRIRQLQRAAAQQRMVADIPRADVIVNNPTHYSIALSYLMRPQRGGR